MKILFFVSLLGLFGFSSKEKHQLTVNFQGLESNKGQVLMKVVDSDGNKISGHKISIKNQKAQVILELSKGSYAISAFHDANKDDKLNTNSVGLPIEIYGFSNNARGWFGPPDLEDQLLKVTKKTSINITLK